MNIKELIAKRAALVTNMRAILNKAQTEVRALNTEEQSSYDKMDAEVSSFTNTIQNVGNLEALEQKLAAERDGTYRPGVQVPAETTHRNRVVDRPEYRAALFGGYARNGLNLVPEHRNALQVGTSSEGGYIVPTEFDTNLVKILTNLDPIRPRATVISTASDRKIPIEASKGSFAYIDEEGAYGVAADPAFGQVALSAFKSGGIVKVADELLQDAFFNLEAYLTELAGENFNTLEETSFATGDGTGKPKGIFATTSVGGTNVVTTTGAVSAAAAITTDNLIDTFHALGRRYRQNASWLTSDTMVKMIRKLKDADNQYLWQPGLQIGEPDVLLGRPVLVTGGAPTPAAAAVSIALVDLKKYVIGDRLGTAMQVLRELYAANGQVGFKFTRRNDGRLTDSRALVTFTHGAAA